MSGGIISTGSMPNLLDENLKGIFGDITNEDFVLQYEELYDTETSSKAFEERLELSGLGYIGTKAEGESINYHQIKQGNKYRTTHVVFSGGVIVTREAIEDQIAFEMGAQLTKALGRGLNNTLNVAGAAELNRGFDVNYSRVDGVPLFSDAHPTISGNQDNLLAGDLNEAQLESAVIQIEETEDRDGTPCMNMSECLIVPTKLKFVAEKLLKTELQFDTDKNTINALKSTGSFPKGYKVMRFLTDPNAWFVKTTMEGMVHYLRVPTEFDRDQDFDSDNRKYKCYHRSSWLTHDFRAIFGSPGA